VHLWTYMQTSIYYEHMDALNAKMEVMGLPKPLRRRVAAYYAFVWKRLRKFSTEHGEFQVRNKPIKLSNDEPPNKTIN
jgi:hypothetical protein